LAWTLEKPPSESGISTTDADNTTPMATANNDFVINMPTSTKR